MSIGNYLVFLIGLISVICAKAETSDLETSVCGFLREPWAFWSFRHAAGVADPSRTVGIRGIERVSFVTRDGRKLGGYRLRSAHPQGYLLVAQGNAMLADQVIGQFQFFRDLSLDVYLYDYRGYGQSEGKSRLKAIVSDYQEIVAALNAQNYRRRLLYGLSMGGVILLNAVGTTSDYDAAVIDSSPSRISPLGCPESYDPVSHLPEDSSRLKIIIGLRDQVVLPGEMIELEKVAASRGASILKQPGFAHPFQDVDRETHRQRFKEVANFLLP